LRKRERSEGRPHLRSRGVKKELPLPDLSPMKSKAMIWGIKRAGKRVTVLRRERERQIEFKGSLVGREGQKKKTNLREFQRLEIERTGFETIKKRGVQTNLVLFVGKNRNRGSLESKRKTRAQWGF